MTDLPPITRFGLPGIDHVPFGMHACHFYRSRGQLISALVPYFVAGLRGNERCLWVTAPPLPAQEAVKALRDAWNGVDKALDRGALRILDFDQWYAGPAGLKGRDEVAQLWLEEEARAIAEGFRGLRITGNTSFLGPDDWPAFTEYERTLTARFMNRRIVALCSYALVQCNFQQMSEVIKTHRCALERVDADWKVFALPGNHV